MDAGSCGYRPNAWESLPDRGRIQVKAFKKPHAHEQTKAGSGPEFSGAEYWCDLTGSAHFTAPAWLVCLQGVPFTSRHRVYIGRHPQSAIISPNEIRT